MGPMVSTLRKTTMNEHVVYVCNLSSGISGVVMLLCTNLTV